MTQSKQNQSNASSDILELEEEESSTWEKLLEPQAASYSDPDVPVDSYRPASSGYISHPPPEPTRASRSTMKMGAITPEMAATALGKTAETKKPEPSPSRPPSITGVCAVRPPLMPKTSSPEISGEVLTTPLANDVMAVSDEDILPVSDLVMEEDKLIENDPPESVPELAPATRIDIDLNNPSLQPLFLPARNQSVSRSFGRGWLFALAVILLITIVALLFWKQVR